MYHSIYVSPDFRAQVVDDGVVFTLNGEHILVSKAVAVQLGPYGIMFQWEGQLYEAIDVGGVLDISRFYSGTEDYPFL